MSLNIKNEETCRLADELASLTGSTKTGAITQALREKLDREHHARGARKRLAEMRVLAQRCASLMGEGPSAVNHGDVLYDETGLPS